jgi:hypothetical protein
MALFSFNPHATAEDITRHTAESTALSKPPLLEVLALEGWGRKRAVLPAISLVRQDSQGRSVDFQHALV